MKKTLGLMNRSLLLYELDINSETAIFVVDRRGRTMPTVKLLADRYVL